VQRVPVIGSYIMLIYQEVIFRQVHTPFFIAKTKPFICMLYIIIRCKITELVLINNQLAHVHINAILYVHGNLHVSTTGTRGTELPPPFSLLSVYIFIFNKFSATSACCRNTLIFCEHRIV
jgi:hypothetical protein